MKNRQVHDVFNSLKFDINYLLRDFAMNMCNFVAPFYPLKPPIVYTTIQQLLFQSFFFFLKRNVLFVKRNN